MSFETLSHDSMKQILPLLESKFPKSAMMINIFRMTLSEKYQNEVENVTVYGYNGIPDAENMFLYVTFTPKLCPDQEYSVIYAPEVVTDEMLTAFSKLQDWTNPYEYGAVPLHFVECLEKLVEEKGGNLSKGPADDMYLPIEVALKLNIEREDLQEDYEIDNLSPGHAKKVRIHWKYGSEVSDHRITQAIRSFGAAGVFKKAKSTGSTNSKEKVTFVSERNEEDLVSWVILMRLGTLNALHTLDDHRRKGLGKWTMEAASKWLAQEELIPLCEIEPYNEQSKRLVEKLGYQLIQKVCWLKYNPPSA